MVIWTNISEAQIDSDSLLMWERQYFVSENEDWIFKKVHHYKANQYYSDALAEISRIQNPTFLIQREKAILYYLTRQFEQSLSAAQNAQQFAHSWIDSLHAFEIAFLASVEVGNFVMAQDLATRIFEGDKLRVILGALQKRPIILSLRKAEVLQKLFPGLGQAYAGNKSRALGSLVLQAGSLTYLVSSFLTGHYLSGVLTGGGLWFRFYAGGIRHARSLAEQENLNRVDKHKKHLRKIFFDE